MFICGVFCYNVSLFCLRGQVLAYEHSYKMPVLRVDGITEQAKFEAYMEFKDSVYEYWEM